MIGLTLSTAQEIMGDNLLLPKDVAKALAVPHHFTPRYHAFLQDIPWTADSLDTYKNDWVMIPGVPLSLSNLEFSFPHHFNVRKQAELARAANYKAEPFYKRNKVNYGWYLFPKSTFQVKNKADAAIVNARSINSLYREPLACEVAFFLIAYSDLRADKLLLDDPVLCVDAFRQSKHHISIGFQGDTIRLWDVQTRQIPMATRMFIRNYDHSVTPYQPAS